MSTLTEALVAIQNRGLNKIRCSLTGAPYATLDSNEIMFSLQASIEDCEGVSTERLVDEWELKALTFNSQVLPALRGVKSTAMLTMIRAGHAGQVKALTYLLTRLLFPHLGSEPMPSETQRERMLFAIHMYDTASMDWNPDVVADMVQQLVVVDAYVAMPYWHTLWAFESAFSKLNLAKAPKRVQETFADPLRITEDYKRVGELVKYMYELMLYVTERDGAVGKSGNRVAQQIMLVSAAKLPKLVIPHFQKTLSEADRLRLEQRRVMDSKPELRLAWSATHGKSRLANGKAVNKDGVVLGDATGIAKMAAEMKAALQKKSAPKKAATPKAQPQNAMTKAFDKIELTPDFAAAIAGLVAKGAK